MSSNEISDEKWPAKKSSSLLREERERRGWTQKDVATRVGSTRLNISRWENGITTPSPYYRQRLSEIFGKSLQDLGLFSEGSVDANPNEATNYSQDSHTPRSAQPIWNVPYPRNPYFTGREAILAYLLNTLRNKKVVALTQALAINGLGGIGKTQIAIEFAFRYRKFYKAIFWINAYSQEFSITDFVALADLLKLPERHEQDQQIIIQAIRSWMSAHTKWLLILDNVDKLETIFDFLTLDKTGDILITTRLQAVGSVAQSIQVENMGLDESVEFLLHRSKILTQSTSLKRTNEVKRAQAVEVVTMLAGLPLALDQAGAYIEETQCGLSQFASLFTTHRKELLLRRGNISLEHPDSVFTTWSLSFQQVEQESKVATDLLRLLAFLNPEVIPEEIITQGATELGHILGSEVRDPMKLNAMIELLLRYSLIQRNSETNCLSIHRLVQAVLVDIMDKNQQLLWAERTLRAVNMALSDIKLDTWEKIQRYLPHIQVCAKYLDQYQLTFPESAQLLNSTGEYLIDHGRFTQAESLLQKALDVRLLCLEANHPDIARTLNNLGVCYRKLGKYTLAEESLKSALSKQDHTFGQNQPDVAQTLYNLARVYRAQGSYLEAKPFYLRALQIRKKTLGLDHPLVAQSYFGLGKLYNSLHQNRRAEVLCKKALNILEHSSGDNKHLITTTLMILSKIYKEQNKFREAEIMNKRSLRLREKISGPDHPQLATIINILIEIYFATGRYREAEPLIERARRIHEKALGPEHPYIAYSLSNLAERYFLQGDYVQAEEYYIEAKDIRERSLGEKHPHTASTYDRLVRLYSTLERFEEAEVFCRKALAIKEHAYGFNHIVVVSELEQYMTLLRKLNRENDACEIEKRIERIRGNN